MAPLSLRTETLLSGVGPSSHSWSCFWLPKPVTSPILRGPGERERELPSWGQRPQKSPPFSRLALVRPGREEPWLPSSPSKGTRTPSHHGLPAASASGRAPAKTAPGPGTWLLSCAWPGAPPASLSDREGSAGWSIGVGGFLSLFLKSCCTVSVRNRKALRAARSTLCL